MCAVSGSSGHDHMNDFIGEYNGVRLAYGRKTGYGSTGPLPGVTRGARVIQLQAGLRTAPPGGSC